MNRKELVSAVADECGFRTGDTELVINTVLKHIVENVANGEEIRLSHFGTFKAIPRNGRVARNPRTGERVEVEAKNVPVFKASRKFKDEVEKLEVKTK